MEIEEGAASADNPRQDLHNSSDECADFLFLLFQDGANKTWKIQNLNRKNN